MAVLAMVMIYDAAAAEIIQLIQIMKMAVDLDHFVHQCFHQLVVVLVAGELCVKDAISIKSSGNTFGK